MEYVTEDKKLMTNTSSTNYKELETSKKLYQGFGTTSTTEKKGQLRRTVGQISILAG